MSVAPLVESHRHQSDTTTRQVMSRVLRLARLQHGRYRIVPARLVSAEGVSETAQVAAKPERRPCLHCGSIYRLVALFPQRVAVRCTTCGATGPHAMLADHGDDRRAAAAAAWDKWNSSTLWLPFSSVPRDGTPVDLWHERGFRVTETWWDAGDECWSNCMSDEGFTHWMRVSAPAASLAPNIERNTAP